MPTVILVSSAGSFPHFHNAISAAGDQHPVLLRHLRPWIADVESSELMSWCSSKCQGEHRAPPKCPHSEQGLSPRVSKCKNFIK